MTEWKDPFNYYLQSLGAIYTISAAFYTYWVFFPTISFSDYLGRIHSSSFFMSSNSIFFTMHSLGIIGFPRRIYDYSMIFFKFQWFNSLGLIGMDNDSLLVIYLYLGRRHVKDYRMIDQINQSVSLITNR